MDILDDDIQLKIWSFLGPATAIMLSRLSTVCRRFRTLSQQSGADRILWAPIAERWTALGLAPPKSSETFREYCLRLSEFEASFLRESLRLATSQDRIFSYPVDFRQLDDSGLGILCIIGTMVSDKSDPILTGLFSDNEQSAVAALCQCTVVPLSYSKYIRQFIKDAMPITRALFCQWYSETAAAASLAAVNNLLQIWFHKVASLAGSERGRRCWKSIDSVSQGLGSSPVVLFDGLTAISELPSLFNNQLLRRNEVDAFVNECIYDLWQELGIPVEEGRPSVSISAKLECVRSMNRITVLSALKRIFYDQYGFHGNTQDYYNVKNSLIHFVISNRTGIPLTLCALFAYIATRAGMEEVFVLGVTGHVMLAVNLRVETDYSEDKSYGSRCFVDCFNGGLLMDVAAMRNFFNVQHDDDWFQETACVDIWLRSFK